MLQLRKQKKRYLLFGEKKISKKIFLLIELQSNAKSLATGEKRMATVVKMLATMEKRLATVEKILAATE